ncbi:unnamed protein product [Pleuronectes platessa]|uniref:Uncharacterized protein n=1 Tax=Pleuronectes platessa TaxID=8262 RepID=A0A9N7ZCU1_PLEPL|nr:unnamed protein product [Pleuronectes platessa]
MCLTALHTLVFLQSEGLSPPRAALSLPMTSRRPNAVFSCARAARPRVGKCRHRRGGQGSLLTHLGPLRGLAGPRAPPPVLPPPPPSSTPTSSIFRADGCGGTFHFPKSERRRAVICQFGLNGADGGLNVVFPPGCTIPTSGGEGDTGSGV